MATNLVHSGLRCARRPCWWIASSRRSRQEFRRIGSLPREEISQPSLRLTGTAITALGQALSSNASRTLTSSPRRALRSAKSGAGSPTFSSVAADTCPIDPNANGAIQVMRQQTAPEVVAAFWGTGFPNQLPSRLVVADELNRNVIELEGDKLMDRIFPSLRM